MLVRDRSEARELRLAYARVQTRRGLSSWRSPRIETVDGLIRRLFADISEARDESLRLLSPAEELHLWREATESRVAAHMDAGTPVNCDTLADGLAGAARMAADWGIALDKLGSLGIEEQWLIDVRHDVEQRAARIGAMARHQCIGWLRSVLAVNPELGTRRGRVLPGATERTDTYIRLSGPLPAAIELLFARVVRLVDPEITDVSVTPEAVVAQNAEDEWRLAASWARELLERDPTQRLRVVIPGLTAYAPAVQRIFEEVLAPNCRISGDTQSAFQLVTGSPLLQDTWIESAFDGLSILSSPSASGERLARWWLASFWGISSLGWRARCARAFRERPLNRFTQSHWRQEIEDRLSLISDEQEKEAWLRFRRADRLMEPWRQRSLLRTPGDWAGLFSEVWGALETDSSSTGDRHATTLQEAWRRLLDDFSALGSLWAKCSLDAALRSLRQLASRQLFEPSLHDVGIRVTGSMEVSYAGYDAIWVCGLRADSWPAPVRSEGFIARSLLQASGVPSASPQGQLLEAARQLSGWRGSTDRLVLSWAVTEDEARYLPSPLLKPWLPQLGAAADEGKEWLTHVRQPPMPTMDRYRQARPRLEAYDDRWGLAWPNDERVRGGVWALVDQSRCAFSAYARRRLVTGEAEEPALGIDHRLRGQLLHEAFQSLWRELGDSTRLKTSDAPLLDRLIDRALESINFDALDHRVTTHLSQRLQQREKRRLRELMRAGLELDRMREQPFRVSLSEEPMTLSVGTLTFGVRVDRVDELQDGRWLVIDYKTGRATPLQWSGEDFDAVQLWLYALALQSRLKTPLAGLAHFSLRSEKVAYRGLIAEEGLLPGLKAAADWQAAQQEASQRISAWADDLARGDAAVAPRNNACQNCELPILCRKSVLLGPIAQEPLI